MYKKILATVNEHLNSEISAKYALQLAKICNAKFYVCFVAVKGSAENNLEKATEAMKRLFAEAEKQDITSESITLSGDPVIELKKLVKHEEIDIVFTSTRREDIKKRFFTGTIAKKLSLALPCSVALVRIVHMGRIHPGKILVPLKAIINHVNERAFFTSKMAQCYDSRVIVFHAIKPIKHFFHGEIHLPPVEWEKKLPKDIVMFMNQLEKHGISYERKLTPGATARNITIEAFTKRHDLIIMGASERGLIRNLLKSGPVEDLLKETPCNLIILKPMHED
jgi:nucleotide-binding universal stress UspA family protein